MMLSRHEKPPCGGGCVRIVVSAGRLDAACGVLDWMAQDRVRGNAVVYQILINAYLEAGQPDKVRGVQGAVLCCGGRRRWGAVAAEQQCQGQAAHAAGGTIDCFPLAWLTCLVAPRAGGLAAGAHAGRRRAVQPPGGGPPHRLLPGPRPAGPRLHALQGERRRWLVMGEGMRAMVK